MRCIFTNRTIGIGCFAIGTNRTIGTNGDPSYHHYHQWCLFVSIGQPSYFECYFIYAKVCRVYYICLFWLRDFENARVSR